MSIQKNLSNLVYGVCLSLLAILGSTIANAEQAFVFAPEFEVGDPFPETSLKDQSGNTVDLSTVGRDKGYLIAFNR